MGLYAIDNNGQPVDWWFMYKVSDMAQCPSDMQLQGTEYVYFDSNDEAAGRPPRYITNCTVDVSGALPNTLNQIYQGRSNIGWWFYNDEDPISGVTSMTLGHSKGVLAFDPATKSAFWLIQSTPKFPPKGGYSFPHTGQMMAQTLLCISLDDTAVDPNTNRNTTQWLAYQMYKCQRPNVYQSNAPAGLDPSDYRAMIIAGQVDVSSQFTQFVHFFSRGQKGFHSLAKNDQYPYSFYNDLVGPALAIYSEQGSPLELEVETWEQAPTPPPENAVNHQVVAMKGINLQPLGVAISWSETYDHAKVAISVADEQVHWVCVGDINFTVSQNSRSGGTVAFQSEPLWQGLNEIFESTVSP